MMKLDYNRDMKTHKGYIIPALLIVVLLIVAGFVTFGLQKTEAPIVDESPSKNTPVFVPQKPSVETSTTTQASTTATTSVEMDIGGEAIIR